MYQNLYTCFKGNKEYYFQQNIMKQIEMFLLHKSLINDRLLSDFISPLMIKRQADMSVQQNRI